MKYIRINNMKTKQILSHGKQLDILLKTTRIRDGDVPIGRVNILNTRENVQKTSRCVCVWIYIFLKKNVELLE